MPRVGKGAIGLTFNQALADEICERLVGCETLAEICKSNHMPRPGVVYAWARENEDFGESFRTAVKQLKNKTKVKSTALVEPKEVRNGRPTTYTEELVEEYLARVESGIPFTNVCLMDGMPRTRTIWDWKDAHPGFAQRLARAREIGHATIAGNTLDIADDATNDYMEKQKLDGSTYIAFDSENVRRSVLRIDTRKWYLGCHDPTYKSNQRVDVQHSMAQAQSPALQVEDNMKAIEGYEVFQKLIKGE